MGIDMLENILLLLPELALSFVENTCETADFFSLWLGGAVAQEVEWIGKVGGSIPGSLSLDAKVFLGKTLITKLPLMPLRVCV